MEAEQSLETERDIKPKEEEAVVDMEGTLIFYSFSACWLVCLLCAFIHGILA